VGVPKNIIYNILPFFVLYMLIFIVSSITLTFFGLDFESAFGATASSLAGIGPGFGTVGPVYNYAHLTIGAKWICSFLMLIGRLELFTVLILFTPFFWRKN
jgi:trk system potassium uptake protein TrkH